MAKRFHVRHVIDNYVGNYKPTLELFIVITNDLIHSFIHSAISIAPLQVLDYSEALPTTARILYRSFTFHKCCGNRGEYAIYIIDLGGWSPLTTSLLFYITERLQFCAKPSDARLELNSDTNVSCCADGTIAPDISWQKIGGALPSHVRFDKAGVLFFRGVQRGDAGLYVCLASNSQGAINATIRVDVVGQFGCHCHCSFIHSLWIII